MKLLCLDIPQANATMEQYQPYINAEVQHGWSLYKSGVVRDIYFRQDRPGVAIIAEAARAALMEFPLGKAGFINWDIIPLGPFLNWELLFAPQNA